MTFSGPNPFLDDLFSSKTKSSDHIDRQASAPVVSQPTECQDQKPTASSSSSSKNKKKSPPVSEDDVLSVGSDSDIQEKLFSKILLSDKKDSLTNLGTDGEAHPDDEVENPTILDRDADFPPKKLIVGSSRYELYFSPEFLSLGDSDLDRVFSELSKVKPMDWSDSFVRPFHVSLTIDPSIWAQVCDSFLRLSSPDDLHTWLTTKLKTHSLAFLAASRHDTPILFHNLCCPVDCGTFVNPKVEFYGLDRPSFDSLPFQIESKDFDDLLQEHTFVQVPTMKEILEHCVIEIDGLSQDSEIPYYSFDPSKLKTLSAISLSSAKTEHDFVCPSMIPFPPCFSGLMLQNTVSSLDKDITITFEDLASAVYKLALFHWWGSTSRIPSVHALEEPQSITN